MTESSPLKSQDMTNVGYSLHFAYFTDKSKSGEFYNILAKLWNVELLVIAVIFPLFGQHHVRIGVTWVGVTRRASIGFQEHFTLIG